MTTHKECVNKILALDNEDEELLADEITAILDDYDYPEITKSDLEDMNFSKDSIIKYLEYMNILHVWAAI